MCGRTSATTSATRGSKPKGGRDAIGSGAPGWLGRLDVSLAGWITHHGTAVVVALVVAEALIGLGALHRRSRGPAVAAGFVLALAIWVVGQDLGQLYSGHATDPNTAPIIALFAMALLGGRRVLHRPLDGTWPERDAR